MQDDTEIMETSSSDAKGKGKKRALPLDLQDIATAIQNLPGDSSALLPTPLPFAQSFLPPASATPIGSSFASSSSSAAPLQTVPTQDNTLTPAQLSSLKLQQAVNRATHRNVRRVRRDVTRGRYTTQEITGVVKESNVLYQDWNRLNDEMPGKGKDQEFHELDQAWTGLNMTPMVFPRDWPDFSFGNKFDANKSDQNILTQRLPDIHFGDSQECRSFTTCEPGTVLTWTKYYKATVITPARTSGVNNNNLAMMPAQPMRVLQPRRKRQIGGKRPMAEQQQEETPQSSKRRLISRAVSVGQLPAQNDEISDGAVHFQPLPLPSRSSSAQAAPTSNSQETNSQNSSSQQSPLPVATSVKFDLISSVSSCLDLVLRVSKFLDLDDILALYSVSRVFKATFDNELEGNVMRMARQFASAETIGAFDWRFYIKVTIPLPVYTDNAPFEWSAQPPQRAPTLRYVSMLVSRERMARDIVSSLTRSGFRLPRTMATAAVKKMWLLMDIPTNQGRMEMLQNEQLFTDADILMIQMLHVKLVLLFHDPVRGPLNPAIDILTTDVEVTLQGMPGVEVDANGDILIHEEVSVEAANLILQQQHQLPAEHALIETFLGQRSFEVLWKFLRRKQYRTVREVLELKVRYDFIPPAAAGHQAGHHLNANEHDVARILSSMATTEAASVPNYFGNFISSLNFQADPSFGFDQPLKLDALEDIVQTVPVWEMGIGHLEGWGQGTQHLLRPDELAPLEAARRVRAHPDEYLDLSSHVPYMGVWGNRDFATGENIIPPLDELYISDNESTHQDDGDDDKENIAVHASPSAEQMGATSTIKKEFSESMLPVTEFRLHDQCGNVTAYKTEWQPYHSLKNRWNTLSLREKIDVWWENHQERLWRQAWSERNDNDQRVISNVNNNVDDTSYAQPDDMPNEADDAIKETYDIGSDFDEDMLDDDFDMDDDDDDDDDDDQSGGGQGTAPRTSPLSTPAAATPVIPLPDSAQNLSRRHKGLVRSCIRWALNEQDEVDAALLAQADMEYEEGELQHWDEFMVAATAAGNTLFGSTVLGEDLGTEDGHDFDSDNDHIPTTPVPNPEEVLAPEFGGLGDVVRLMHQVREAVALADGAMEASRSDDPNIASMAGMRLPDLVKEAEDLKTQLAAVLQGEVFAIEV